MLDEIEEICKCGRPRSSHVVINRKIAEGLIKCHRSSLNYGPYDNEIPARWMDEHGFAEAAEWVRAHPTEYASGLLSSGFCWD